MDDWQTAKDIVTAAGGVMQGDVAQVPCGYKLATVDKVRTDLEAAGYKVLAGNVSFVNQVQLLKISKK